MRPSFRSSCISLLLALPIAAAVLSDSSPAEAMDWSNPCGCESKLPNGIKAVADCIGQCINGQVGTVSVPGTSCTVKTNLFTSPLVSVSPSCIPTVSTSNIPALNQLGVSCTLDLTKPNDFATCVDQGVTKAMTSAVNKAVNNLSIQITPNCYVTASSGTPPTLSVTPSGICEKNLVQASPFRNLLGTTCSIDVNSATAAADYGKCLSTQLEAQLLGAVAPKVNSFAACMKSRKTGGATGGASSLTGLSVSSDTANLMSLIQDNAAAWTNDANAPVSFLKAAEDRLADVVAVKMKDWLAARQSMLFSKYAIQYGPQVDKTKNAAADKLSDLAKSGLSDAEKKLGLDKIDLGADVDTSWSPLNDLQASDSTLYCAAQTFVPDNKKQQFREVSNKLFKVAKTAFMTYGVPIVAKSLSTALDSELKKDCGAECEVLVKGVISKHVLSKQNTAIADTQKAMRDLADALTKKGLSPADRRTAVSKAADAANAMLKRLNGNYWLDPKEGPADLTAEILIEFAKAKVDAWIDSSQPAFSGTPLPGGGFLLDQVLAQVTTGVDAALDTGDGACGLIPGVGAAACAAIIVAIETAWEHGGVPALKSAAQAAIHDAWHKAIDAARPKLLDAIKDPEHRALQALQNVDPVTYAVVDLLVRSSLVAFATGKTNDTTAILNDYNNAVGTLVQASANNVLAGVP